VIDHPRACHPTGPSTDRLVCDECGYSPMDDWPNDFTTWDDHWDTHEGLTTP